MAHCKTYQGVELHQLYADPDSDIHYTSANYPCVYQVSTLEVS